MNKWYAKCDTRWGENSFAKFLPMQSVSDVTGRIMYYRVCFASDLTSQAAIFFRILENIEIEICILFITENNALSFFK